MSIQQRYQTQLTVVYWRFLRWLSKHLDLFRQQLILSRLAPIYMSPSIFVFTQRVVEVTCFNAFTYKLRWQIVKNMSISLHRIFNILLRGGFTYIIVSTKNSSLVILEMSFHNISKN